MYDAPLQNPELVIRRLVMEAQRGKVKPRVHAKRVLAEIGSLLEGFFDLGQLSYCRPPLLCGEDVIQLLLLRSETGTDPLSRLSLTF